MKGISVFFGILAVLLPMWVHAAYEHLPATLNEKVWYLDTEVLLNGTGLKGSVPSKSKLCFAPEAVEENLLCFLAGHGNIKKWSATSVTFIPPKNTPPNGIVVLVHPYYKEECTVRYGKSTCETKLLKHKYIVAHYKAHPHIAAVVDAKTGAPVEYLEPRITYEIKGYRFGDTGVGVYLGSSMIDRTDVLRWSPDSILFKLSEVPKETTMLRVNNGAGLGNKWVIKAKDPESVTVQTKTRGSVQLPTSLYASVTNQFTIDEQVQDQQHSEIMFADVSTEHPYAAAILWAMSEGIVQGYEDGTFGPELTVNRAELLKLLFEARGVTGISSSTGETLFSDVLPRAWYAPYVAYAQEAGIVQGYADGTFRPEQPVIIAEALKVAYRVFAIPTVDPLGGEWYARYLEHAWTHNMLFSSNLDVQTDMTRQDIVWLLWRLAEFQQGGGEGN